MVLWAYLGKGQMAPGCSSSQLANAVLTVPRIGLPVIDDQTRLKTLPKTKVTKVFFTLPIFPAGYLLGGHRKRRAAPK